MVLTDVTCGEIDPIRARLHHFIRELPEKFGLHLRYGETLNQLIDELNTVSGESFDAFRPVESEKEDGSLIGRAPNTPTTYWVYNRTIFLMKAKGLESFLDTKCGNSRLNPEERRMLSPTTINVNPQMNQLAMATSTAHAEAKSVSKGDLTGLMIVLSGLGVTAEGMDQLRGAVETDQTEDTPVFGESLKEFVCNLAVEAAGGVGTQILLASPEKLPAILRAIGQFFGNII